MSIGTLRLIFFVFFSLLSDSFRSAEASYVFSEENGNKATYVMRMDFCLIPGAWVEFHTQNLSESWADPQMHILKSVNGNYQEVYYDDDSYDGTNPSISFITSMYGNSCTNYRVLVRAVDNNSGGNGGVEFDFHLGTSKIGRYSLGGFKIFNWYNVSPSHTLETVLVNEGASAAMIYRFELASDGHHKYISHNLGGGVGNNAAKMTGSNIANTEWVIATPYSSTREGAVRILQNEQGNDTDGDGLCDMLELGLQTCKDGIDLGYIDCSNVNPRDSDGDGLEDAWEAIGIDNEFFPQRFYLWGANPKHKDVFVEIDRQQSNGVESTEFSEYQLDFTASRYRNLDLIDNPDGVSGVDLHFDIGYDCTDEPGGDTDGITSLCGDFGGSGIIPESQNSLNLLDTAAINFSPERYGLFHWVKNYNGGGGSGYKNCFASQVGNLGSNYKPSAAALAHELGHNLGLYHSGSPIGINHNPIYGSLMNYAYSYEFDGHVDSVEFSQGNRDSLQSDNLSETTVYSPGVDIGFLAKDPINYTIVNGRVDWNRDGFFDSSVQASIAPRAKGNIGLNPSALTPAQVDMTKVYGVTTEVGLGVEEFEASAPIPFSFYRALWVFANEKDTNVFRYRNTFMEGPWAWSSWYTAGTQVFRPESEPTVSLFDGPSGERLYVFGVEDASAHNVKYAVIDKDRSGDSIWSTIVNPPGVEFFSVASATLGNKLYIVGKETTGDPDGQELWINSIDGNSGAWSGWSLVQYANNNGVITSLLSVDITPGFVGGPDGSLYLFPKENSLSSTPDRIGFYRLDLSQGSIWSRDLSHMTATQSCELMGKPGVAYQGHKDANGNVLARGNGGFWAWYRCENGETNYLTSRGNFDSNGPDTNFRFQEWYMVPNHKEIMGEACMAAMDSAGVAVTASEDGIIAFTTQDNALCQSNIAYMPHADGQSDLVIADHNDHEQMESALESSLDVANCGATGNALVECLEYTP